MSDEKDNVVWKYLSEAGKAWTKDHPLLAICCNVGDICDGTEDGDHVSIKAYFILVSFVTDLIGWMIGDSMFNAQYKCNTDEPMEECSSSSSSWGYSQGMALMLAFLSGRYFVRKCLNAQNPGKIRLAVLYIWNIILMASWISSQAKNADWSNFGWFFLNYVLQEYIVDFCVAFFCVYCGCAEQCSTVCGDEGTGGSV